MPSYEPLQTVPLDPESCHLYSHNLPELVFTTDPALLVMLSIRNLLASITYPKDSIDDALEIIKKSKISALLVVNEEGYLQGIIAGEDILGEKPIQLLNERRVERSKITVDMIMTPVDELIAVDYHDVEMTRVGNIINTLKSAKTHYALVLQNINDRQLIKGLFVLSQIAKQLHRDLSDSMTHAETLLELEEIRKK